MQIRTLCEGVTCSHTTAPPLRKARHLRVVPSHVVLQPPDSPTRRSQSNTQLWLLARNQIIPESLHVIQRAYAHHYDAATGANLSRGSTPFLVTKPIVN